MADFKKINSSNLDEASYDTAARLLIVKFKNGTAYCYPDFPAGLYAEFEKTFTGENGLSAGRFFSQVIRSLPSEKIEDQ